LSDSAPEVPVQGPDSTPVTDSNNDQGSGGNPWDSYVTELPESVRPLVEPIFKKWDADVTQKFQSVHSQYEPYKGYEPVIQSGYDPEDIQQAIAIAEALNENPRAIYDALLEQYGPQWNVAVQGEQGQNGPDAGDNSDLGYTDPKLQQIEQMTNAMAEILLSQREQEEAAREDAELEQYLGALKEKYGEYDADFVLAKMYAGMDGEQAVQQYQQLVEQARAQAPRPNAPVVLGSGGGLPSQQIDPAQLNNKDTKALVAQLLAQAAQSGS
jgi:hypothetical protein